LIYPKNYKIKGNYRPICVIHACVFLIKRENKSNYSHDDIRTKKSDYFRYGNEKVGQKTSYSNDYVEEGNFNERF
jgi:hypothetical protein